MAESIEMRVLQFLAEHPGLHRPNEIADDINARRSSVATLLSQLAYARPPQVERSGRPYKYQALRGTRERRGGWDRRRRDRRKG